MSSQTERDRSTDALLKASLPGLLPGETSACVDAETLAAWSERAMLASEAARIDVHLADCARCQAMLAAFVRTEPEAAAALPFWQRWPVAKWLVPAATIASIVVIVAVVTRETAPLQTPMQMARQEAPSAVVDSPRESAPPVSPAPQALQDSAIAQGAGQRQAEAAASSRAGTAAYVAPAETIETVPAKPSSEPLARAGLEAPAAAPPARNGQDLARRADQEGARANETRPVVPLDQGEPTKLDASAPAAPRPGETANRDQAQAPASRLAQNLDAVVAEIVSAPRPLFGPAAGRSGRGRGGATQAAESATAATTLAATVPARWRILSSGRVERSTNGGATWRALTVDAPVAVGTGTSPSDLVCWLIGRGGVVLLSTDGLRFERRPFPDKSDLISVTAVSERQASVMTADGRAFVTYDGGASWTRQP